MTSRGRLLRFTPVDLPSVPANSVQLAAGARITDYLGITDKNERVLGLVSLESELPIALGTAQGVVKRVAAGGYPSRHDFEVVALKPGDEVVGVAQGPDSEDLVFVTSDAQLLHFPASQVRPQGVAAGGMAGINRRRGEGDARSSSQRSIRVRTSWSRRSRRRPRRWRAPIRAGRRSRASGSSPRKGRATGGVRAHTFLKGEDSLALAWVGPAPALAVGADGSLRTLPDAGAKRDASGTPMDAVVGSIGRGALASTP